MGKWENGSVEGGADQVEQRLHIQGFNQGDDGQGGGVDKNCKFMLFVKICKL